MFAAQRCWVLYIKDDAATDSIMPYFSQYIKPSVAISRCRYFSTRYTTLRPSQYVHSNCVPYRFKNTISYVQEQLQLFAFTECMKVNFCTFFLRMTVDSKHDDSRWKIRCL